ncbi:MAG: hypothetical protein OEZ59_05420 [Deltaproteobacteria bacterium]|nr:hypothetical protein [Deltaproteobacteria bacterium]
MRCYEKPGQLKTCAWLFPLALVLVMAAFSSTARAKEGAPPAENGAEDRPFFSEGVQQAPPAGSAEDSPPEDDAPFISEEAAGMQPQAPAPPAADEAGSDGPIISTPGPSTAEKSRDATYSRARVSFQHRYKVLAGGNHTRGIFLFFTGRDELREARLLNSYQQTIRIEESPTEYKFVKFSIDFTQNYDFESEQFFDSYFVFNEIFVNSRDEKSQYRFGNQVYKLGKIDLGSPIDVLHYQSLTGYLTLDSESTKESLPSFRYDFFGQNNRFTLFLAPIATRTFGMRLTKIREDAQARDQGEQPEKNSMLREYGGLQWEWLGSILNVRMGLFRWFDNRPQVSWELRSPKAGTEGAFEGLITNYTEDESRSSFFTLELDLAYKSVGWKLDLGVFNRKNFYDYQVFPDGSISFDTVGVPHLGLATSVEKALEKSYIMLVYTYQKLWNVPEYSHVLFLENEEHISPHPRDLEKHGFMGFYRRQAGDNQSVSMIFHHTFPFRENMGFVTWAIKRPQFNSEWALKVLVFKTEEQKMTGDTIDSRQLFLTYTRNFSG